MNKYYFEFLGDLEGFSDLEGLGGKTFSSQEEALGALAREWGWLDQEKNDRFMPDPEDDRVLLWEVSDEGCKIVWHFSGWHWSFDAEELPGGPLDQGILPTKGSFYEGKSLYELVMSEY